jgi:chromosome partitioning protein
MRTWVFASQKGGAGKSTLCTQLGVFAQQSGERVAIVDIDPQGSAFEWSKLRGKDQRPEAIRALPSDLNKMVNAARDMDYSLLLVDTAPHVRADVVTAIRVADLIICPTKSAMFELEALKDTVAVLDLSKRRQVALGVVNGILPVKEQAMLAEYDHAIVAMQQLGLRACAQFICHRKAIIDAIGQGKGVTETEPKGKAANEIRLLYQELLSLQPSNIVHMKDKANG